MKKGQTSVEALIILATVLIIATSILYMTTRSNETDIAVSSAREKVQNAISRLTTQYGTEISIEKWDMQRDNITFHLSVKGTPPPQDETIEEEVERINSSLNGGYKVNIEINRVYR